MRRPILLEGLELDPRFKQSIEVSGTDPVRPTPMSKIFLSNEKVKTRDAKIQEFFKDDVFTYEKFKNLLKPAGEVFYYGPDGAKLSEKFAKPERESGESGELVYDEYVETFFMYLFYQLFSKMYRKQTLDLIVKKNYDQIKNAKENLIVLDSLKADFEEGISSLYDTFQFSLSSSLSTVQKMNDKKYQGLYFKNFADRNVEFFLDYPISQEMKSEKVESMRALLNNLYDRIISLDIEGNRQIESIKMVSNFIKSDNIDFVTAEFQELVNSKPSLNKSQKKIFFPENTHASVEQLIEELCQINDADIAEIGFGWAVGTKWLPYIKFMCGIISLEEISEGAKKSAERTRAISSDYVQKLDVGEKDDGVFFIYNNAFVQALTEASKKHPVYSNLVGKFETVIENVARRTQVFQGMSGTELANALFFKPDQRGAAVYIDDAKEDAKTMDVISTLTNLRREISGADFTGMVTEINYILFKYGESIEERMPKRILAGSFNYTAIKYAAANVGDTILEPVRKNVLDAFTPSRVYQGAINFATKVKDGFTNAFNAAFYKEGAGVVDKISTFVEKFNETFSTELNFAQIEKDETKDSYTVRAGGDLTYTATPIPLKSIDDVKNYVLNKCVSMSSIMYHSKVCFGGSYDDPTSGEAERYSQYFNLLSWFIKALGEYNKDRAAQGLGLTYLITPFLVEVIKYSFRGMVNNIPKLLREDNIINEDQRKFFEEAAARKDYADQDELNKIIADLSVYISAYLDKHAAELKSVPS